MLTVLTFLSTRKPIKYSNDGLLLSYKDPLLIAYLAIALTFLANLLFKFAALFL